MKKLIAILAILGILTVGLVAAHGFGNGMATQGTNRAMARTSMAEEYEPGFFHEQMEEVMEQGTFNDLQELRQEAGFNIMPWVDSEDDFELAKQMHERMEQWREENGYEDMPMKGMMGRGFGRGNARGFGMQGGCPMMQ